MRIIILLLCTFLLVQPSLSQQPTKKEMQEQMQEEIKNVKKEIADLEKQIATAKKENTEGVKELEGELKMLKQQLSMMEGLNKSISNLKISDKQIQEAVDEENKVVPVIDDARINSLPNKVLTDVEMVSFIKNVHTEVEKLIPADEKTKALAFYNEAKTKYKSPNALGSAASGCWMYGHQEKALYIMGKACIENMNNSDNLNNYAAFLSMTGAEQAAIPILEYLNNKYPNNNTILNNLGQAWFGLGNMTNAKKYLDNVIELYLGHSQANLTLSKVYLSKADSAKAIACLKNSIKESFSADKEGDLNQLDVKLTFDELPDFNFPMDPLGDFKSFFSAIPAFPKNVDEMPKAIAEWEAYEKAKDLALEKAEAEFQVAKKEQDKFLTRMASDLQFQKETLEIYNSPAHNLATRLLTQAAEEETLSFYPLNSKLLLALQATTFKEQAGRKKKPFSFDKIFAMMKKEYHLIVDKARLQIMEERDKTLKDIAIRYAPCASEGKDPRCPGDERQRCAEINMAQNNFLAKLEALLTRGDEAAEQVFDRNKDALAFQLNLELFVSIEKVRFSLVSSAAREPMYITKRQLKEWWAGFKTAVPIPFEKIGKCIDPPLPKEPEKTMQLPVAKTPDCPYSKDISTGGGVKIRFECATIVKDESKLKDLKEGETRGSTVTGKGSSAINMPPMTITGTGPIFIPDLEETENSIVDSGPLTPAADDTTQMYLEYDKYGNLTDIKIPLNKDGTAFANADSKETGEESRWCWISCASGREKKMKGLFKKH